MLNLDMGEDFFLTDFSLEDIDFEFNIYDEINVSPDETIMDTQSGECSSNFDHQRHVELARDKPKQTMKTDNKPRLISFDLSSNVSSSSTMDEVNMDRLVARGTKRKTYSHGTRSPVLAKEHILAERKRRQKLSQKFIALSALLPGLKKADKVTVLDDAISHLKQLQEQIRKLKEEKEATREMKSMILVKKSKILCDEEPSLSYSLPEHEKIDQALLDIEAKVARNEVLIRIHCEKSKWSMINVLKTIEDVHLHIVNSVVLPFGNSTVDITILAQMENDFSMNVLKDLVRNLRLALV